MRRKDREMPEAFALDVADRCLYGVLATVNGDGSPYCVPLSLVRRGNILYFHSAKQGQKIDNMRKEPRVSVACVGSLRVPKEEFSVEYESAVIAGVAREVLEPGEKRSALYALCGRHTPDYLGHFEEEMAKSAAAAAVWAITIESITGKRKWYDENGAEMKYGRMD